MTGRKKYFCIFFAFLCAFCLLCEMPLHIYAGAETRAVFAAAAGTGSGTGSGTGQGAGSGTGQGAGSGTGQGAGSGTGQGAGSGTGQGAGGGAGQGAGGGKTNPVTPSTKKTQSAARKKVSPVKKYVQDLSSRLLASSESSSSSEAPSSSSELTLPSADSVSETDPLASAADNRVLSKKMNLYGILAWACIALCIAVILIVVLSNRFPPRGPGRSRYRRRKHSKNRLLGDRYYRNINRY